MKKHCLSVLLLTLSFSFARSQTNEIDHSKIQEDFNQIIRDISSYYVYSGEKKVDLDCIKEYYEKQIPTIKTEEGTVLFFEYLLDEFYDSHVMLNTNRYSSYRLHSPIYASIKNEKPIISSVWLTHIEHLTQEILGAELLMINGMAIEKAIDEFPTHCSDKQSPEVKEWILNKVLAGRYNEPRILTLKLKNKKTIEFDLDQLTFKSSDNLLSTATKNDIGIIRFNNSLGNNDLIKEFDKALDQLMDTKGLIIDLRNTVGGGNTYVARGIMGRFIEESKPYQKHLVPQKYDGETVVERSWVEYVSPRKSIYKKPVVVLVGRWTGSMGEGFAIGFEGMERGTIVGTEMERLAGEMNFFPFKHRNFGYRLSIAKLFHVNGAPREEYVPQNYVQQTTIKEDETLEKGIKLIINEN